MKGENGELKVLTDTSAHYSTPSILTNFTVIFLGGITVQNDRINRLKCLEHNNNIKFTASKFCKLIMSSVVGVQW